MKRRVAGIVDALVYVAAIVVLGAALGTSKAWAGDLTVTIRDVVITDGVTARRCAVVVTTATGCTTVQSPQPVGMPKGAKALPASATPRPTPPHTTKAPDPARAVLPSPPPLPAPS